MGSFFSYTKNVYFNSVGGDIFGISAPHFHIASCSEPGQPFHAASTDLYMGLASTPLKTRKKKIIFGSGCSWYKWQNSLMIFLLTTQNLLSQNRLKMRIAHSCSPLAAMDRSPLMTRCQQTRAGGSLSCGTHA